MNEIARQMEQLNNSKPLREQNSLVSIDYANVRNWRGGLNARMAVDILELVKLLKFIPIRKDINVYAAEPFINTRAQWILKNWMIKNEPVQWQEFLNQYVKVDCPSSDWNRILTEMSESERFKLYLNVAHFIDSKIGVAEITKNVQGRVRHALNQAADLDKQRMLKNLGVKMVTKTPKPINSQILNSDTYGGTAKKVLSIIDQIEENIIGISDPNIFKQIAEIRWWLEQSHVVTNKCNMDGEIIVDCMTEEVLENYDNFVFFSGDGDFAVLYRKLVQELRKKVLVVTPFEKMGQEIKELANEGTIRLADPKRAREIWSPMVYPK